MSVCEWNPKFSKPAGDTGDVPDDGNCPNQATVSVGMNGKWHLCESCASRPAFKHFRYRKPLKTRRVSGYSCTFMASESGYKCPACGAEVIPFVTHHCGLEKSE